MRLVLLLVFIFGSAGAAQAQTVQIRSGEHQAYSRLTMVLPRRLEWNISSTEEGAEIVFKSSRINLDTSAIFNRIPRERITQVTWAKANKTLKVTFDCACEANVFWHGESMLVLDVRDLPEKAGDTLAQNSEHDAGQADNLAFESPRRSTAVDLMLSQMPATNVTEDIADGPQPTEVRPETRDRLLMQIGRAASQGLLAPQVDRPKPRNSYPDSAENAEPAPTNSDATEPALATDHINLKAQSSIDRDFLGSTMAQRQNLEAASCLGDQRINVASWGDDKTFGEQVSALRRQLTGEFDQPNPDVTEQLLRLYLYFGFGAEARVLLNILPEDHADHTILLRLSLIAENGHAGAIPFSTHQLDCASPAALWAALSFDALPSEAAIDADAILRAFNGLPGHLRAYYGPTLAQRFTHAARPETAAKLLRILDRSDETKNPQSQLAKADLHAANGEQEQADHALQQVVDSHSEPSIEAVMQMIDQRFETKRDISFELAQLAGAYAYEHQNDEAGPALAQAYVRALVASGAIDQAFAEFEKMRAQLGADEKDALQSDLFDRLAHQADDFTFLRHALPASPDIAHGLQLKTANAVINRLLNLGFPDQATASFMEDIPLGHHETADRKLLKARLALANHQPRRAIVELLGLVNVDANLLRAEAHSMAGDHGAAYHLYVAADRLQEAQRQAWLAENWAEAATPNDSIFAELAMLFEDDPVTGPGLASGSVAVLAQNRELVADSRSMRETFDALLTANPAPENTDE